VVKFQHLKALFPQQPGEGLGGEKGQVVGIRYTGQYGDARMPMFP